MEPRPPARRQDLLGLAAQFRGESLIHLAISRAQDSEISPRASAPCRRAWRPSRRICPTAALASLPVILLIAASRADDVPSPSASCPSAASNRRRNRAKAGVLRLDLPQRGQRLPAHRGRQAVRGRPTADAPGFAVQLELPLRPDLPWEPFGPVGQPMPSAMMAI
jgi:hypothetical protein